MPFGDGTGPMGFGPMTGRAAGYCAGYPAPGSMNPMVGAASPYAYAGGVPMHLTATFSSGPKFAFSVC